MKFFFPLLFFALPLWAQEEREAKIMELEGEVLIFYQGSKDWAGAETDSPLEAGDRIKTGPDSRTELSLDGEVLFDLGENSELVLNGLALSRSSLALKAGFLLGKIQAALSKDRVLEVRTVNAVCAVRGTELAVSLDPETSATEVGVFEGKVHVAGLDDSGKRTGEVLLGPEQETEIRPGRRPIAPRRLKSFVRHRERMKRVRGRLAAVRKDWRGLPPEKRKELRQKFLERHRERIEKRRRQGKGRFIEKREDFLEKKRDRVRERLGVPTQQRKKQRKPGERLRNQR